MQEYWVNVYGNNKLGYPRVTRKLCDIFQLIYETPLYRIHVKMKPKPKPKYEEIPYLNSGSKFY